MSGPSPSVGVGERRAGPDLIVVIALGLLTLVLGVREIARGGFGWSDAPQHAMDGALVLAFLRELPLGQARAWLEEFYLRHPAIGLGVYWPPGFAFVEAAFFAVGGVSVVAARFCVIGFASGAVALMYLVARRWLEVPGAICAAALLLLSPLGAAGLYDIMLEWPAMFWLLLAVHLMLRYVDRPSMGGAASAAFAFLASVLTKQTTSFIGPILLVVAWLHSRRGSRAPIVWAYGAAFALIAVYFAVAQRYAVLPARLLQFDLSDPFYYGKHFGEIGGWSLVGLIVFSLHLCARHTFNKQGLLIAWFAVWLVFCSIIRAKEPRYFFFALPPLAIRAGSCVDWRKPLTVIGRVIVVVVLAAQLGAVQRSFPNYLSRYDMAVTTLRDRGDADLVLIDAVRDGQFVFDAYCDPIARDMLIPLRGSKLLYARASRMEYAGIELVHSEADVRKLLDRYAIKYVLIESALPARTDSSWDPAPRRILRRMLADGHSFRLLNSWPLKCDDSAWDHVDLRLYRYEQCPPRTATSVTLPMPSMGTELTIPLPPTSTPPTDAQ